MKNPYWAWDVCIPPYRFSAKTAPSDRVGLRLARHSRAKTVENEFESVLDGLRRLQDGPKRLQDRPRRFQDAPRRDFGGFSRIEMEPS